MPPLLKCLLRLAPPRHGGCVWASQIHDQIVAFRYRRKYALGMTKRRNFDGERPRPLHHFFMLQTAPASRKRPQTDRPGRAEPATSSAKRHLRWLCDHARSCACNRLVPPPGQLSEFLKQWKRTSSIRIKRWLKEKMPSYASQISMDEPIWQVRSYGFNLYTRKKFEEKLIYMHLNPCAPDLLPKRATGRGVRLVTTSKAARSGFQSIGSTAEDYIWTSITGWPRYGAAPYSGSRQRREAFS